MSVTTTLVVKGTRYYQAASLIERSLLTRGTEVTLEHQINNPHDQNAVAVKVKSSGAMLGHLPREAAAKYAKLIHDGKIINAAISRAEQKREYVNVDVRIAYEGSNTKRKNAPQYRFSSATSVMPAEPGVYALRNVTTGRKYIGSSGNVRDRVHSHFRELFDGTHANHLLQSDFSRFGIERFEVLFLEGCALGNLLEAEARHIASLLSSGEPLYNMTFDGQGRVTHMRLSSRASPISDRLDRPRVNVKTESDRLFYDKRNQIIARYDAKLAAILPKIDFWIYFFVALVIASLLVMGLFPRMGGGQLFLVVAIAAFIVARLLKRLFEERAKASPEYQAVVDEGAQELSKLQGEYDKS